MALHQLQARQILPITQKEAWEFLSDPGNLQRITPPQMGFKILSGADRPMFPGQIIQYIVTPLLGMKTRWVTEITHVKEGEYFVDEQRFGPYSLWHHKHFITPIENGVIMEDLIDYKVPFGFLGNILNSLVIQKQLRKIFHYREEVLRDLFGNFEGSSSELTLKTI